MEISVLTFRFGFFPVIFSQKLFFLTQVSCYAPTCHTYLIPPINARFLLLLPQVPLTF